MAEPPPRYVHDQTISMRVRLLCGLYSKRAESQRWRPLAQAYCLALPVVISYILYYTSNGIEGIHFMVLPSYGLYYLSVFVSLWTGDEYLFKFFTLNKLTDITLDSSRVFNRLQKRISRAYMVVFIMYAISMCVYIIDNYENMFFVLTVIIPLYVFDMFQTIGNSTKLLVMALVDARLLVLKRRLQRYGFRSSGYARSQDYCEVYHQTMRGLDETDCPLKVMIFFDWITSCGKIIYRYLFYIMSMQTILTVTRNEVAHKSNWFTVPGYRAAEAWKQGVADRKEYTASRITVRPTTSFHADGKMGAPLISLILSSPFIMVSSFGHVALLESAAAHCEDMVVFSATQLIKTPTEEERRRILTFMAALEHRGARYHVLRALPLNARLVLGALSFCSAQMFLFITAAKY